MWRPGQRTPPCPPQAAPANTPQRGHSRARYRGLAAASAPRYDAGVVTRHATRSFYHLGALGSVMEITDMNEAEVASYRYDPYGAVTITVGGSPQASDPLGNPWMYTSRFTDEETGLYYYRARYYSPATGRFLQRDPLSILTGPNLYEYVRSSPQTRIDPHGLAGKKPSHKDTIAYAEFCMESCPDLETGRQCQECCGMAVWDAVTEMNKTRDAAQDWCATQFPAAKEELEEYEREVDDLQKALTGIGWAEKAGAIAELGAVVARLGHSLNGFTPGGGYAAGHGASALVSLLAKLQKEFGKLADNKYYQCKKKTSDEYNEAMADLAGVYGKCLDKCRKHECGGGKVTKDTRKAWKWLFA